MQLRPAPDTLSKDDSADIRVVDRASEREWRRRGSGAASNALLLATVTATLKNLLENGLVDKSVTGNLGDDATISALPPDRIETGTEEKPQLNLFLYQVKFKGLDGPSRYSPGAGGASAVSAGYELYYLLTAYGAQDFQIEVLLGAAMEQFRDTPLLVGSQLAGIFRALGSLDGGRLVLPGFMTLDGSPLAERIEQLRITPHVLAQEEMLNLWGAFQARYRPSATYRVTVHLRDEARPAGEAGPR